MSFSIYKLTRPRVPKIINATYILKRMLFYFYETFVINLEILERIHNKGHNVEFSQKENYPM